MSKTSIQVQYVNQPKNPKGPGSIKTNEGVYYKVWPHSKNGGANLSQFEVGKTYELEYDTEEYNGKPSYVARKILSSSESSSSNGHVPVASSNGKDSQILWQVCLKAAAQVLQGTGASAGAVLVYAHEFYNEPTEAEQVAEPIEQEVEL